MANIIFCLYCSFVFRKYCYSICVIYVREVVHFYLVIMSEEAGKASRSPQDVVPVQSLKHEAVSNQPQPPETLHRKKRSFPEAQTEADRPPVIDLSSEASNEAEKKYDSVLLVLMEASTP